MRAGAVLSAFLLAACDPIGGAGEVGGPEIGQLVTPGQPVRVALLAPAGSGSADWNGWRAASRTRRAWLRRTPRAPASTCASTTPPARPVSAVAQANAAADAGAQIIVGPLFADAANAVGSAMLPRNVNVLSLSNNSQVAGGNVFILGNSFENVADRLVGYGLRQGKRNVYVVAEDDVAGQLGGRAIERAIARNGARLAGRTNHPVSISGVDAATPRIAAAARSGQVDAVFMTGNNQAVLPYLTERLAAAGVTSQVTQFMGLTRWDQPTERLRMPQLAEGWFAIPDQTLLRQFEARYADAHGEAPHPLAFLAYDGVAAVASLARTGRANALTTTGLTQRAGFAGVGGIFRLQRDGTIQRGLSVATIRGGQLVILDPAPRNSRGLGS